MSKKVLELNKIDTSYLPDRKEKKRCRRMIMDWD